MARALLEWLSRLACHSVTMQALNTSLFLAIILRLSTAIQTLVPPTPCPIHNARYLPIYDLENVTLNVLRYDEFLTSFTKDGFYQFKGVETKTIGGMFYGDYPVLVVYQPDENVPELHGYHYPSVWGLQLIYDTGSFDSSVYAEYQHFRDFLNVPIDKEGYTPAAALQIFPELESMKMTKIVQDPNQKNITQGFTLLFLLPKKEHPNPENFYRKYRLFEEYYYNGTDICQVKAEEDDDERVPLLTVYSHRVENSVDSKENNVVDLDQLNEYFSENGFYKFEDFVAQFSLYDEYPTLIVFQPDEKVPELHGYYFDEGILSMVSSINDNPKLFEEYRPFFEYLKKEPDLDGLTPEAARFDYPYFFDYKLTAFTHGDNVNSQGAILFLAPARYRPTRFLEKYTVIEDYGIVDEYIVEYEVGDALDKK